MAEYPNSGTLGRNKRKEQPNHPDHTGQANIDGVDYWVSAWIKDGKDGSKFFSLSFKPKDERPAPKPEPKPAAFHDGLEDDVPF